MIREERNPAFWDWVCSDPAVSETLMGATADQVGTLAGLPQTLPLASEHGGFLFIAIDSLHRVYELHTLYRQEGWGREVHGAGKAALTRLFETGCEILTTYEVEGHWRSRPPKTFGFVPAGEFFPTPFGNLKTWFLTRSGWTSSPAGRPKWPP